MRLFTHLLTSLTLAFLSVSSQAAPITFTDATSFASATSGLSMNIEDYESSTAGALINDGDSLNGVTYSYPIPDSISVENTYSTTSGNNYLGLATDGYFIEGDSITFTFSEAMLAIGLYIIGEDIFAGDFELSTSSGTASNTGAPVALADGDAYFIGILASNAGESFTQATITGLNLGFSYVWNMDDLMYGKRASVVNISAPPVWLYCLLFLPLVFRARRA